MTNSNDAHTDEDVLYYNQLMGHLAEVSIYLSTLLFAQKLKDSQEYEFLVVLFVATNQELDSLACCLLQAD